MASKDDKDRNVLKYMLNNLSKKVDLKEDLEIEEIDILKHMVENLVKNKEKQNDANKINEKNVDKNETESKLSFDQILSNQKLQNQILNNQSKVLLNFLNKIMVNIGQPELKELSDFKNVGREDVNKKENLDSLIAMENELFPTFDKNKTGYYKKNNIECYVISFLKSACKIIGYKLHYVSKTTRLDDKKTKTKSFYTIKVRKDDEKDD